DTEFKNTRWNAIADVLVVNADNPLQVVNGALVYGEWSGLVNSSTSAITGTNGIAVFNSPKTNKDGTITFTVTDVSLDGWDYDGLNPTESIDCPLTKRIIKNEKSEIPDHYVLLNNYPNPFNPRTKIEYSISEQSPVNLKVYDVLGTEVSTLVNKEQPQGNYEVEFDGSEFTSGIYFYRLNAGEFVETKKMILIK
ncbi:MAG: T9SS type A sorting domain-containing protein, partial [Melioribacteraceae bacterium]|nr:T9SS type A sorting domain-containing protein [Melioribacteraceae bacterium]